MAYLTFATHTSEKPRRDPMYKRYRQLLDAYEGKVIHGSRTLDEFYYHFLSNMEDRNADQVVTKWIDKQRRDTNRMNVTLGPGKLEELYRFLASNKPNDQGLAKGLGKSRNTRRGEWTILRVDQL